MQVNSVIQQSSSGSSPVSGRDLAESRTVSPQTAVDPNASPERPVNQVSAVEELPEENLVDVEQAREVFARELGASDRQSPENPLSDENEASQLALEVRSQFQSDAGQALRAQASRTPSDSAGLLGSP